MVAATLGPAPRTKSTANSVVMCSSTTRRSGRRSSSPASTVSMNTVSRSNTSTAGSVTSPCTSSGRPVSAMAASTGRTRRRSRTPASEWVVAPAGYSFTACTQGSAAAAWISSGVVASVRYSVISGSKSHAAGTAARMRSR